jgi:hypothetical protein
MIIYYYSHLAQRVERETVNFDVGGSSPSMGAKGENVINHKQFRELIIKPSLKSIDLYSENDEELLILTLANESLGGTYLKQINGHAWGPFQCEPNSYLETCSNHLYKYSNDNSKPFEISELGKKVNYYLNWYVTYHIPPIQFLATNLSYATIICRLFYLRAKEPIPDKDDVIGLFNYYKRYYNTSEGKATEKEVIDNYHLYLRGR